jgi:hypothetical protein
MALTLDNSIGGEHSNSYVDLAYADAYWDSGNVFNALQADTWSALSESAKVKALIKACSVIETLRFTYKYGPDRPRYSWLPITYPISSGNGPFRYDPYQALQFPRNMDFDSTGSLYIPDDVKMAQCEQAMFVLTADKSAIETRMMGITMERVSVGSIGVTQEFAGSGAIALSPDAYDMLVKYVVGKGNMRIGRS